ncbi:MAG: NADH-quinone oxidoreductase subunit N [Candidatus Dadabacteria bacterium]|nr:MAG: NADH-quinone oxidoreductase subunit N [Candidatus Dadabacteria bacterium]
MDLSEVFKSTLLIGPEISLIIAGLILIVLDPILKGSAKKNLYVLALLGLAVGFILNLKRFGVAETAFSGALSLDQFAAYFNIIFLLGAFLSVIISRDYLSNTNKYSNEFFALILFSTSGMMILSSAKEFMSLFLGFEIMSISVYILAAFNRKSARSTEAGIKYLILGGFSSAILLYGIALLYGASGSVYLDEIVSKFDPTNPLFLAGSALVLVGFIFKIGAFPLHQWVPDVYEGAPMPVTAFMSVGVKAAAFAILLRVIFEGFSEIQISIMSVLWIVAVFTMVVGNIAAIAQKSIKRMLAYSSIAHAGYALVGVVAAYGGDKLAVSSVIYYLFAYMFMNLGAFGVLAYLSRDGKECETFDDISGLWRKRPYLALALGVFMFSLAGIPPTLGFFAKYRLFLSAVQADFYWLAVIGILSSVVSAYYYLRVLVYAYMKEETATFPSFKFASSVVLIVLCIGTLVLGVFPFNSWNLALEAAGSVLHAFKGG